MTETSKLKTIDIILNLYPSLKKDKQFIINTVLSSSKPKSIVFDKVNHYDSTGKQKAYYVFDDLVYDEKVNVVGNAKKNDNGEYELIIPHKFNDKSFQHIKL